MKRYLLLFISIISLCSYAQTSHTIITPGNIFSPDTINAYVGDTIIFSLGSTHNAVEVDQSTWIGNGAVPNGGFNFGFGQTATYIPSTAQTYYYVCQPHVAMGMKGVIIVSNPPLQLSLSATNISCYGGTDGEISAIATGGTPPYQYSIDGGVTWQSSNTFTGLAATMYTVLASDFNSFIGSSSVMLTEPDSLMLVGTTLSNVLCCGGSDGSINITVYGGTTPYNFNWTGPSGLFSSSSLSINNLAAGTYTLIVTDANGCSLTNSYTITEPPCLTATHIISGNSITIYASGGIPPYQYRNSTLGGPYQISNIFHNLPPGTYHFLIQDASCASYSINVIITGTTTYGCTDPLACNYDSLATVDDSSCVYATTSTSTAIECDSLVWNSTTYTSSGTYTWVGTNAAGCDSTATLNLTINTGGCMDSIALNYDSTATCDNGSCVYFQNNSVNLFFSECAEGSSGTNNRYFEIYNPTTDTVDLADYAFARVQNSPSTIGVYETWVNFDSGAVILPLDVYVVAHSSANATIQAASDMNSTFLSSGDDGMALVYGVEPSSPLPPSSGLYMILDWVGDWNGDPGNGWDVAGETAATRDHTLIRKCAVSQGDTSWTNAAGTNTQNSQWIVFSVNSWSNIGQHDRASSSSSWSTTICNGLSITVGNSVYDSTGTYVDTLETYLGCDSIVTTQLTVLTASASIVTNNVTICNGDSILVGSSVYNTTGIYSDTLVNASGCDSIINTTLTVQTPVFQDFTICDGDSLIVGSSVYNISGTYIDTITSSIGCDSIVHTTLTIFSQFNSIFGGIPNNSVGGGGFYSGSQYLELSCYMPAELVSAVIYSQDTTLTTFEIRDDNGNVLSDTTYQVIPGGHRIYFNYQMSSGIDYQLGVNGSSNDLYRNNSGVNYPYNFGSLASITSSSAGGNYYYFFYDIEVRQSSQPTNYSICDGDSITIAGSVYNISGLYVDSLTSSIGCDSLVYTNLVVYPNTSYINNQTICSGESYVINGNTYDSMGVYIDTLGTMYGCDSIVTTDLTVLTISGTGSINPQTICVGDSYSVLNPPINSYTVSGTYYDTLVSSNGCDSVVTTNLTVVSANYPSFNGGILDSNSATGAFSNYDGHLIIDNNVLSVLHAATVYAEDTNDVTFELRDNNGVVLESIIHTVYPGSQRLIFDFMIPVGNDFELGVDPTASNGVLQLYRSNAGQGNSWPYPFNLGPTTITSSNAGNRYYYYYYDIEIMSYATHNPLYICDGDSIQVGGNWVSNPSSFTDSSLIASNGCDSIVFTTVDFYSHPPLYIESSPDPPVICLGDTVMLEASPGFLLYAWNNGATGHFTIDNPTQTTWYVVEALDSNSCVLREDITVIVDSCITGIGEEITSINDVLIYPNPTKGYANISFESVMSQDIYLKVYNTIGEELKSIDLSNFYGVFNKRINLLGYAKGIYFVEIITEDGIINQKIMLQ